MPKDGAFNKKKPGKGKLCCTLDDILRRVVGSEAQPDQRTVESLVRTGLGLLKARIVRPLLVKKVVSVGDFGKWHVERMREFSALSIILTGRIIC